MTHPPLLEVHLRMGNIFGLHLDLSQLINDDDCIIGQLGLDRESLGGSDIVCHLSFFLGGCNIVEKNNEDNFWVIFG